MIDFLETLPFTHFLTVAPRLDYQRPAIRRMADRICDFIDAGKPSTAFWVAERSKEREGYHLHFLLTVSEPRRIKEIEKWIESKFGFAKIGPKKGRASHYVCKELSSKRTEYDLRTNILPRNGPKTK